METILIVDDEMSILELYGRTLKAEGFKVLTAASTVDANKILYAEHIDCVVLDMKMPHVHGCSIYRAIRLFHPETKVIVNSSYPLEEQKTVINDADGYFEKSEGIGLFMDQLHHVLRAKPLMDEWLMEEDLLLV